MMTLEEAIDHCEEVAKKECGECAEEHLQLAKWLKELKERRSFDTDLISRKHAINALSTITMYKGSIPFDTAVMRIEQLPSVQPEPHWIPVTERLPQASESVMICDAYGDICIGHRTMGGYYFPDFCDDKIKDVRAWCELPEPYKGVTE